MIADHQSTSVEPTIDTPSVGSAGHLHADTWHDAKVLLPTRLNWIANVGLYDTMIWICPFNEAIRYRIPTIANEILRRPLRSHPRTFNRATEAAFVVKEVLRRIVTPQSTSVEVCLRQRG